MSEGEQLHRTESASFPAGHLGHLTSSQQQSLDAFKSLCQERGYFKPTSDGHPASHDDETLLRYLRARRFDPAPAFTQFRETEDWRRENELERLYETIDVQEYEETRRLYPQWTGRRDRRGMPVYLFEVSHLDSKAVAAYTHNTSAKKQSTTTTTTATKTAVPVKMLRLFALYENLTRFVLPLCTAVPDRPHKETPITQSNNIVDISGVGLWQFWNLKAHMQDASQLATAHYPETLDRIFIIGAPSFFPTVWGWIKRWFDPVTVSKIFILGKDEVASTLERYIERENIPQKYGGSLVFQWGDLPNLEPAIEQTLQWKEDSRRADGARTLPTGPIRWQRKDTGATDAIAVGTEAGVQRQRVIGVVPAVAASS